MRWSGTLAEEPNYQADHCTNREVYHAHIILWVYFQLNC